MQIEEWKEVALKATREEARKKGSKILASTLTFLKESFLDVESVDTTRMFSTGELTRKRDQIGMIMHLWHHCSIQELLAIGKRGSSHVSYDMSLFVSLTHLDSPIGISIANGIRLNLLVVVQYGLVSAMVELSLLMTCYAFRNVLWTATNPC